MKPDAPRWVRPAIFALSLLGLLSTLLPENRPSPAFTLCLLGAALLLFYRYCAPLMGLSENNPKTASTRSMSRLGVVIVLGFVGLAAASETLEEKLGLRSTIVLLCAMIAFLVGAFGNISPTIPFNRYFGLRLPWTIRDEITWNKTHQLVGQISFPCVAVILICCVLIEDPNLMLQCSVLVLLIWLLVPSVYSLWFYCKRYRIGPKWLYKD